MVPCGYHGEKALIGPSRSGASDRRCTASPLSRVYDTRLLTLAALGRVKSDLVIRGVTLINVYTAEIQEGVDIAVKGERIAYVGPSAEHCIGANTTVIDGRGLYAAPGFLDGHVHIESSMVTPSQYAKAVLRWGTTGVFADPHEIGNVLGAEGVRLFIEESRNLPLKVFVMVPSCVPAAAPFETAATAIPPRDVDELMALPDVYGLGEVMDYYGLLGGERELHAKIQATLKHGKTVTGHAAGLRYRELAAYAASGIRSCHEATTKEEALSRARLGIYAKLRYGSAWHDLPRVIKAVTEAGADPRRFIIVTDDVHPEDLLVKGHLNYAVRRAIEEGCDPVRALQMVTLNVAECYGVSDMVGGIAPGRYADIVLLGSLTSVEPKVVIAHGKVVAKEGRLTLDVPEFKYPEHAKRTVKLRRPLRAEDFTIKSRKVENGTTRVHVIEVREGEVLSRRVVEELPVKDREILPDTGRDVVRVAVVERHRLTGNIGLGFVRGFGVRSGAVASTVAHDSHNMVIVGVDREDMAYAGNKLAEVGGGMIAVENRRTIGLVELPVAGLMSEDPVEIVAEKVRELREAWRRLGCTMESPFMTMSILTLTVLPELRITDKGLLDTVKGKFVELET